MLQREQNSTNLKQKLLKARIEARDFITDELWVYIIVIGSIALCSWITNHWIEGVMFCVAHIYIRKVFDKQFHFYKTGYCLILTLGIVWLCIPISLPVNISFFSSIPIAFAICYFGWYVQNLIDNKEMFHVKQLDIKHLTKEQVIDICNDLDYKKDKQDLAIMFFVDKLTNKEVWNILCTTNRNVEWDTVTKYKYRITKDFKQYIKDKEQV